MILVLVVRVDLVGVASTQLFKKSHRLKEPGELSLSLFPARSRALSLSLSHSLYLTESLLPMPDTGALSHTPSYSRHLTSLTRTRRQATVRIVPVIQRWGLVKCSQGLWWPFRKLASIRRVISQFSLDVMI